MLTTDLGAAEIAHRCELRLAQQHVADERNIEDIYDLWTVSCLIAKLQRLNECTEHSMQLVSRVGSLRIFQR